MGRDPTVSEFPRRSTMRISSSTVRITNHLHDRVALRFSSLPLDGAAQALVKTDCHELSLVLEPLSGPNDSLIRLGCDRLASTIGYET